MRLHTRAVHESHSLPGFIQTLQPAVSNGYALRGATGQRWVTHRPLLTLTWSAQAISGIEFFFVPLDADIGPDHTLVLYNAIWEGVQTAVSAFVSMRGDGAER
jgi:hypothetical protein